jgi:hypothetical protein
MIPIGFDTETHLISAGNIIPRLVCASFCVDDTQKWVRGNNDEQLLRDLAEMFRGAASTGPEAFKVIIQNAAFDITVILRYLADIQVGLQKGDPKLAKELYQLVWQLLDDSMDRELDQGLGGGPEGVLISDTLVREKLFWLSTRGQVEGQFSLADLVKRYFDVDISAGKEAEGAWRMRYSELDGVPAEQYPPEAYQYALGDAVWARAVWLEQEKIRAPLGHGSMNSESLQIYADTVLRISSSHGMLIDKDRVKEVAARMEAEVAASKMQPLVDAGVLRPNGSVNTTVMKGFVERAWATLGRLPRYTDKGAISLDDETRTDLAGIDPIIDLYSHRQEYQKILTAFLPNLTGNTVYTNYSILKETGRTSSFGNDKKKSDYPAVNIQQMPKKEGVRECFKAREGYVLVSVDYSALELCSVAQVTYKLFGRSVHLEKINSGYNLHSFLGAQIAAKVEPVLVNYESDPDITYSIFEGKRKAKVMEGTPEAVDKERATHFRTLAKPTGLGFPGGLGPDTMVTYAKTTYEVDMDRDTAQQLREFWRQTYPEMVQYFNWVNRQQVGACEGIYAYTTDGFNRYRTGATFCATANGKAMQSLSADGAKRAVAWLGRAFYGGLPEDSPYAALKGCRMLAFIHDEVISEVPEDQYLTEKVGLISDLMVMAMRESMPDVLITTECAAMRNWSKKAEAVWSRDEDGNKILVPFDDEVPF